MKKFKVVMEYQHPIVAYNQEDARVQFETLVDNMAQNRKDFTVSYMWQE